MGRQKSSTAARNALITQFFKKADSPSKSVAKNDENALTEQEIQERNRRLKQRAHSPATKQTATNRRPALSDKSGIGGGLGPKRASKPVSARRQEPACSVLCDPEEGSNGDIRSSSSISSSRSILGDVKREAVREWETDEQEVPAVRMPRAWGSQKTTDENKDWRDDVRSRATTPAASQMTAEIALSENEIKAGLADIISQSTIDSQHTDDSLLDRVDDANDGSSSRTTDLPILPTKRPIEDDLLVTTTRRKVLGLKPSSRQTTQLQEDNENCPAAQEHQDATIPPAPSSGSSPFFDDDDDDDYYYDNDQAVAPCSTPLEFSISSSVSYPAPDDDKRSSSTSFSISSSVSYPAASEGSRSPRSSAANSGVSADSTLPLPVTDQYEEHVAFPVPRGKTLLEKLGIRGQQDIVPSSNQAHDTDKEFSA